MKLEELRCPLTDWLVLDCVADATTDLDDTADPDSAYDLWRERGWS